MSTNYAYFEGRIVPASEAKVSISTHALQYGTGCFEGIRAYWNPGRNELYVLKLREHMRRMSYNMRLLRIALPETVERMCEIVVELLRQNEARQNTYIRPFAYKSAPYIGLKLTGLEDRLAIYTLGMGDYLDVEKGLSVCVSSWVRPDDNSIPPRGKLTGSYVNACIASDEAKTNGYDEALELSSDGHVSEGSSSNLFVVRNGTLITSPVSANILEGITRAAIFELASDMGIPSETRAIDRTELYVADEMFLCGTGVQLAPITSVDRRPVGDGKPGPISLKLQQAYFAAASGEVEKYRHWLTPVYGSR